MMPLAMRTHGYKRCTTLSICQFGLGGDFGRALVRSDDILEDTMKVMSFSGIILFIFFLVLSLQSHLFLEISVVLLGLGDYGQTLSEL